MKEICPKTNSIKLKSTIYEFADLVSTGDTDLGITNLAEHVIDTGDNPPIKFRPYRAEMKKRAIIEREVEKMLNMGLIEMSKSEWAFPVVLIDKPDGSVRFCVDYRALNKVIKKDSFPLPRIMDIIPQVANNKFFASIDLASGYHQIPMSDKMDSKNKTTFTTHVGTFRYLKMPFGESNAPATFQRAMQVCLGPLLSDNVFVYLDDVLIVGKTFEEFLERLRKVLQRLREANLKIKLKKCEFAKPKLKYLGHILDEHGMRPNPKKVEAMLKMPPPTSARGVRGIVGSYNFYSMYIPHYSDLMKPLNTLLRKNVPFKWTEECQESFEKLKQAMSSPPVIAFPNFDGREFHLYCDASAVAAGSVLIQYDDDKKAHPLGYFSRTFHRNEQKYSNTEREMASVLYSLEFFRPYLYGNKCTVYTDHIAAVYLGKQENPKRKAALFQLHCLGEINWEIKYVPGKENFTADLLSRTRFPDFDEVSEDQLKTDQKVVSISRTQPGGCPMGYQEKSQVDKHAEQGCRFCEIFDLKVHFFDLGITFRGVPWANMEHLEYLIVSFYWPEWIRGYKKMNYFRNLVVPRIQRNKQRRRFFELCEFCASTETERTTFEFEDEVITPVEVTDENGKIHWPYCSGN